METFLKEMRNTYIYSKKSIENSYKAFEFIDSDFRLFLETFFHEDATQNSFLLRIYSESEDKLTYFQDFILKRACDYFKKIINIDNLKYTFDSSEMFPDIEVKTGGITLISINIFYKEIIIFENNYLKDLAKKVKQKEKEKCKLEKKYEAFFDKYGNQNLLQSLVAIGTGKSKQIKSEVEEITYAILEIEDEISELKIYESQIQKQSQEIIYIQERIKSRILSKLDYNILID